MYYVRHNNSGELVDDAGRTRSKEGFAEPIAFSDLDEAVRFIDFRLNGVYDYEQMEKVVDGKKHTCYSIERIEEKKKECGCPHRQK
jgi:hypothetical protein